MKIGVYFFSLCFALLILSCMGSRKTESLPSLAPSWNAGPSHAAADKVNDASEVMGAPVDSPMIIQESGPAVFSPTQPADAGGPTFRSLKSKDRENLILNTFRGSYLEEKRQFDRAGDAYRRAMELAPNSAYLGAVAGGLELQNGRIDKAVEYANKALRSDPNQPEAYRVLGQAYIAQQNWDAAIRQYEKVLELEPRSLETMEDLAIIYSRVERYDDALNMYKKLAQVNPIQAVLYRFRIATLLYELNRFEEALVEYRELSQLTPAYYEMQLKIGNLQELLGQVEPATATYETALTLVRNEKEEILVRQRLGALYRAEGDPVKALEQYKRIQELAPDDMAIRKILALLYIEQGQYENAIGQVDAVTADDPGDYRMQLLRREILEKLGRGAEGLEGLLKGFEYARTQGKPEQALPFVWELARDATLKAMEEQNLLASYIRQVSEEHGEQPETPRYLFGLAKAAIYQKDAGEVRRRLEAIVSELNRAQEERNENYLHALSQELRLWFQVRQELKEQGLLESAIQPLNRRVEVNLADVEALWTLGALYSDQNRWDEAEKAFKQAKEALEPDSGAYDDIVFQLASVYEKLKRVVDVEALMKEAMERNPEDAQAYNFLGYTYADQGVKLEEAQALIEKALSLNPEDGNIIDSLGWVHYRRGQYEEAVNQLKKAAELEENHPVILDHLGDALDKQGEWIPAIESWKKALEFGPGFPYEFTPEFQERIQQKIREAENHLKP